MPAGRGWRLPWLDKQGLEGARVKDELKEHLHGIEDVKLDCGAHRFPEFTLAAALFPNRLIEAVGKFCDLMTVEGE